MKNDEKATAKIIILHIVSDVPGITYHLLMDKCLESLYMNYFTFSECFNELVSSNLLDVMSETDGTGAITADSNKQLLYITRVGTAVLDDIKGTLSVSVKKYLSESKETLLKAIAINNIIKSSVEIIDDCVYALLTINDDNSISFQTKVKCETQEEATELCNKWRKNAIEARNNFLDSLKK